VGVRSRGLRDRLDVAGLALPLRGGALLVADDRRGGVGRADGGRVARASAVPAMPPDAPAAEVGSGGALVASTVPSG
jgi:hypothetical protein